MRRRILLSTSLIALAAVVLLGLPLAIVGTALLHQRADMGLERRADAAALRLARAQTRGENLADVQVRDLLPRRSALQVTTAAGVVTVGTLPTGSVTRQTSGDGGPLRVTLIAPNSARGDDVGTLWLIVALAGLGAVAAAAVLALVQARRLARPLEQLAKRVERVGQTGYDGRAVAMHLPEIDQVQRALNDADHRITDLVQRERQFTANASHQMRTPLTALRMRLEELEAIAASPEAASEAAAAMVQVERLITTIEHLEVVARHRDDQPDPCDVGALITDHLAAGEWTPNYQRARRTLVESHPSGLLANVEPESVRQILDVLLDNALRHGRGTTTIRASNGDGWVRISVSDQGDRPAGARAQQMFDRGYGTGTGIGLAVARDLALRAGGDLRLDAQPSTTLEVLLPATRSPAQVLPKLGLGDTGRFTALRHRGEAPPSPTPRTRSTMQTVQSPTPAPLIAANDGAVRSTIAVGLLGIALVHVIDGIGKWTDGPRYEFWLYMGLVASSFILAGGLLFTRHKLVLPASVGLVTSAMIAFILSRTTGLPSSTDDIGNWTETIGVVNLFVEVATLGVAVPALLLSRRAPAAARAGQASLSSVAA